MANWWEKYKKNTGYPTSNPAGGQKQSGGNWWEEYKRETNFPEGNTQKQATAAQENPAQPKAVLPGIVKPSQIRNGVLTESSDGGNNAVRVVPNVPNVQTAQPEQPKTEYEARMEGRQYEQTHQTDAKYYTDKIDYAISQGAYASAIDWMEKMTRAPLTDESRQQAQNYINTLYDNKGLWGESVKTGADRAVDKILYAYDRGADMFANFMTSEEGQKTADAIAKKYGVEYDEQAMKDPSEYIKALRSSSDAGAFWSFAEGQKGFLAQNAYTDFEQRAFTEMEKAGKAQSTSAQMDSYIRAQMAYSLLDSLYNYMDVGGNTAGLDINSMTAQYIIRHLKMYGVDLTAANETNYRELIRKAMQEQGDKARIMGNVLTNEGYDIDAVRQYMEYQFDVMYEQDRQASANEWAKNASGWDKAAATLASYAEHTFLSGFTTLGTYAELLGYAKNDDDPNKFVPVAGSVSNADLIQSAVGQSLGETGAFFYGVGNSMIESFLRNASAGAFNPMLAGWGMNVSEVPKGLIQTLTLSQMGVSVAGSTANQILQRGGNSTQAIIGGLASGTIEAITEVASLEVLLDKVTKAKGFLGWLEGVGLDALAEGSEEGASNILNLIVDAANMGNLSEQSQAIQQLLDEGKTLEEAQAIVLNENIISLAEDMAAGALSGGGEGVIAGGANVAFNKGSEIYYNMKNKDGSYKHIRYFTEQQQKNANEAAKAYLGYSFNYYFGDQSAMQAAGMTEKEAETAAKEYERIQKEYSQITGEKVGTQNGSKEASAEEGTAAGQETQMQRAGPAVDSMTFTPETAKEDAQSVMELHRQMEQSGQLQDRNRAAQLLKTAEDAMMNVQNAQALGLLNAQEGYDTEIGLQKVINNTRAILTDTQNGDTRKTPAQMTAPENNIGGIDNGRAEGINDSTERNAGLGADQQDAAVQRSAEKATERGRNASIEVRRAVAAGEYDRASAKSLGIERGSERESMQLLRESVVERIDALRTIRDEAAQDGVKAVFFTGDCEVYNKYANKMERIEGVYVPDSNTVYVKADKINRSAAQIYSHEMMHNMIHDNPGMLDYALQLLGEQYTPEELERIVDQYREAYHGIYGTITEDMTEDERREVYMKYVEEICADAYAGIRRGGINTVKAEQAMAAFRSDRTDGGKENAAATERTNGPNEQRYSVEDDTAYISLAEKYRDGTATEAETEQLRQAVEAAAKKAGYDTPILYHGTDSFGFTEFDLSKMDDKRSIFATSSSDVARTYSGAEGTRAISDTVKDVSKMSETDVVDALNNYVKRYGDGLESEYSFVKPKEAQKISEKADAATYELSKLVSKKISEYADKLATDFNDEDYKAHNQLVKLQEMLYLGDSTSVLSQLYMLINHTDALDGTNAAQILRTLTISRKVQEQQTQGMDISNGFILRDELGGYILEPMSIEDARATLDGYHKMGNYALVGKTGRSLTIDANGQRWNELRNWIKPFTDYIQNTENTFVYEEDGRYYLIDKATEDVLSRVDKKEATKKLTEQSRHFLLINNAVAVLRMNAGTMRTTRAVAQFARNHGYDSVVFQNMIDNGGKSSSFEDAETTSDVYVVFNPEQYKSADLVTYDDNGNIIPLSERFNPEKKDIRYSVEDDVAELDEGYQRSVQRDAAENEPTERGVSFLPKREQSGTDYGAIATAEIERRARDASLQQLRNMVKATDKELNYYRRLQREGRASAEDMQKMKTVEETAKIQNEELKHKNAEERKQREKRQEEEAKQQQPRIAKKELKANLAENFHVAPDSRKITNDLIEQATNKILQRGYLDAEDKRSLFNALLRSGVVNIAPEGYYGEIRSYVQQGRIFVSESVREEFGDDWNEFRKRAWDNRIYLTSDTSDRGIDDWNADLASMFPGGFEEGTTDMKLALEQIVQLAEEGKAENITIAEMMERNKDNYGWTVESQMEQLEEQLDAALKSFAETAGVEIRVRQEKATEVLRERKKYRDMIEQDRVRRSQKRLESEIRDRAFKLAKKMKSKLNKVNPEIQSEYGGLLRGIDTVARSFSVHGLENLVDTANKYREKAADIENFIPNEYVEKTLHRLYEKQIDDMSIEEVLDLTKTLLAMQQSIRDSENMLSEEFQAKRKEIATMARKELEATKGSKDGFIHKFAAIEHLEPRRFFEYIFGYVKDGAGAKIAQMMEDGGINQIQYLKGGFGIFEKFTTDKDNSKWLAKASGKNAEWIEVEIPDLKATKSDLSEVPTRKIEITPMMRVALYMHSLNYANQRHAYDGGITIPNKEYYIKGDMENAVAKGITMPISPGTIRAITAGMTEQERQFAKLLQQYFDKYSKEKINEVSLKADGYERANVNQYFPIKTNKDYLGKKTDKVQKAVSVENYGALKERQTNAKTTIILEDASVTLADHLENMSNYYGFAIPIRDLNAVLSYNFYDEKGNLEDSVIGIIKDKWGASAEKYIDKLLKDLQGNHVTNDLIGKIFSRIRSNLAGAQLKLNPSVALAQFASYPAATQTLGELALLEGLNPAKRADINLIGKYTPLLWYRMQGNSTIELGDYNKDKPLEKKFPLLMNWVQGVDTLTIKRLWIASEYYVKNNTDLRPGSEADIEAGTDEFYQKVAEMFNRAVFDTQPNYSTMQRAQILRSNNELVKSVTMFMTVPIKYYNMMFEASGQLINAQRRGDKAEIREAGKYFFNTTFGLVTATLLYDFFKSFWKGIKHHGKDWLDEEGNFDIWLYIKDTFGHDFIETVAGSMVGGSEAFDLAEYLIKKIRKEDTTKYYGAEVNVLQWGNNIAKHAGTIVDGIANGDAKKIASGIKSLVITGSMGAFSIPAQNAETYAISMLRLFSPEAAERYENLFSDRTKSSLSEESGRYLEAAISVYMDNRTEDLPDEVKQELQRLWEAGQKNAIPSAVPSSVTVEGESIALTSAQKAKFREEWSRIVSDNLEALIGTEYYQDADETTQGKMIDRLYQYASQIAKENLNIGFAPDNWAANADADNLPEYLTYATMTAMLDRKGDAQQNETAITAIMDYVIGGLSDDDCAEITRLYMDGADGLIPKLAPSNITYKDENGAERVVELDAAERKQYGETYRNTVGDQLSALMSSQEFASADDATRAALIGKVLEFAAGVAKAEAAPDFTPEKWIVNGMENMEDGIRLADYIIYNTERQHINGKNEDGDTESGLKDRRTFDLIDSNDWTDDQKISVYTDNCSNAAAEKVKALDAAGFGWTQIKTVLTSEKPEYAILNAKVPDSAKLKALGAYCSDAKMNRYQVAYRFGVSFEDYAEVKQNADADESGSITQEEAKRYIMSMALTQQESAYLWQMVTDGKNGTKNPFNKELGAEFYYEMHKND